MVTFNLTQYFSSLQHRVIITLLKCMGFATQVCDFFVDYLVRHLTQYAWKGELSLLFETSVGVGQGSALSPILSALYLALVLWQAALDVPEAALMSYINDGTIIMQSKMWAANVTKLLSTYSVVFELTQSLNMTNQRSSTFPERVGTSTLWLISATPHLLGICCYAPTPTGGIWISFLTGHSLFRSI